MGAVGDFQSLIAKIKTACTYRFQEELRPEICLTVSTLTALRYLSTVTRIPKIGFAALASVICAP